MHPTYVEGVHSVLAFRQESIQLGEMLFRSFLDPCSAEPETFIPEGLFGIIASYLELRGKLPT